LLTLLICGHAGATVSKGLNRVIGTILGGGLGCLAAALAQQVGGIGNAIVVDTFVFVVGKSLQLKNMIFLFLIILCLPLSTPKIFPFP
jgi:uncharacterized membrane protein YccC